jgi:gamma-glutamyltranspeptidase/glutathione hydrolase
MQIVRHLVDHDLDIAGAVAHPRIRYLDGRDIGAEPGCDPAVVDELRRRGHRVRELSNFGAGGAQAIVRDGDRLHAASDPRKDGCAQTT